MASGDGNEHVRAGLHQHTFIHGHVSLALILCKSQRSEFPVRAPLRNPAGAAEFKMHPPCVSATMRDTPVFSAKISKGNRTLRFH